MRYLLVAATLLAGLVVAACSHGGASSPDRAAVEQLLAHHADAIRTDDTAAAAADLDSGSAATAFRERQRQALDALHQLPVQTWSYEIDAPVTDQDAIAAAGRRYGTGASIVHLTLRYQLRGVDAVPVAHELWWTFTSRLGQVRIAGDDDLAAHGGLSWRGPWDFGSIVVQRSTAGLVIAPPSDAPQLAALSALAAHAVGVVTAGWGGDWPRQITVVVPADASEAQRLGANDAVGTGAAATDVAAVTIAGQRDPASGRVGGLLVVLNPTAYNQLSTVERTRVFVHETTHVASADDTEQDTPRWVVEGLAEYVSRLGDPTPVASAAAELSAEIRDGDGPTQLPGDEDFLPGNASALGAYQQAWLACRLIAERVGTAGLVTFYRSVGTSPYSADRAVDLAVAAVLHESTETFTAQWLTELRTELTS